jgi:membrane protease YdiL (CAAX protease family)
MSGSSFRVKYTPFDAEEKAKAEKVPISYRLVSWGPVAAVVWSLLFFFASQVMAVFILIFGAMVLDGQTANSLQVKDGPLSSTTYQFLGNLLVAASMLLLIKLYLKRKKTSFKALGFYKFKWKRFIAYGLAGLTIYLIANIMASVVIGVIWPEVLKQQQDIGFNRAASGLALVPIFISLVILPPLIEETLCRGFLFGGLRKHLHFVPAVLITSGLFALAHLPGGENQSLVWSAVADTFLLSLVLCWLRERTGSLWASMLLHGIKNSVAFATIFIFR